MELLWKWKIFPSHFHQKWAKLTENASKWLEIFAFWHLAQSIQFLSIWKNNQFKNWRFFRPISIKNWRKWLNMVENGRKIVHFDTQLNRFHFSQFEKMTSCKIEDFSDPFPSKIGENGSIWLKMVEKLCILTPSSIDSISLNLKKWPVAKLKIFLIDFSRWARMNSKLIGAR